MALNFEGTFRTFRLNIGNQELHSIKSNQNRWDEWDLIWNHNSSILNSADGNESCIMTVTANNSVY